MDEPRSCVPLYDAHCHLQDSRLSLRLPRLMEELSKTGVQKIVVNGTSEGDWDAVLQLGKNSFVLPSLGLHPWYVAGCSTNWLQKLSTALESSLCAVGEIGLDRWMANADSKRQEEVFREQLALAARLDRPVSIHCLKAWGRLFEILSSEKLPSRGFLLHSYGGPAEMVDDFARLGAYFSFSGYFAQPRKVKQRETFQRMPADRLLMETDAPDMGLPEELQQFKLEDGLNHPANLRPVYEYAAEFLGVPLGKLAVQVEKNFQCLFGSAR